MKFKTTAIALAVAGSVAAPVAVQAGADELYASARVGVWSVKENHNNVAVRSFSSRFGAKGETDLGNGLTGFGRYEWDVDFNADNDGGAGAVTDDPDTAIDESHGGNQTSEGENDISVRHRYVGLKGDFGSALVGQTYHTFYNFAVGPVDNPWWHSGYTMVEYRSRTDNGVTYAGGSGDFNFGATVYMDKDDDRDNFDQYEIGGSMAIGDMTLAIAALGSADAGIGSDDSDTTVGAITLSGISIMEATLNLSLQAQEDDVGGVFDLLIGNAYVHVEYLAVDKDSGASVSGDDEDKYTTTLGYTQSLGRKTTMYYELAYTDNDSDNTKRDRTAGMAVLKYDII
jgi:predicted porin